ncbi:MAG: hypothetical protein WCE21_05090 [Candidatus Babeliales bacterium]
MNKSMNTKTLLMKITQSIIVSGTLLSVSFAANPPTIPTAGPAAIPTSSPAVPGGAPSPTPAANPTQSPATQPPAAAGNAPAGGPAQHAEQHAEAKAAAKEAKHEEHAQSAHAPTPAPTPPPVVPAPTPEAAAPQASLPMPANPPVAPTPTPAPAGPPIVITPLEEPKKEEVKGPLFEESSGLDNINLVEGGNWYLKRQALEQTVDTIEQINELFNKIVLLNTDYLVKRNKVDTEMEHFLLKMGIDIGDLDQRLQEVIEELDAKRKKEGELSEEKRDIEHDAEQKKAEVEKLQSDLKDLLKLNDKLDATMEMVSNQIKKANDYQAMAWKNFQTIKKILSDEKARELYYQTDGLFKSILGLYEYLQTPLMNYFTEHIEQLRSKMGIMQSSFDTLKTKGIDLQKTAQEPEKKVEGPVVAKPKEIKKVEKQSWFGSIIHTISLPFVYVYEGLKLMITEMYQWIFGTKKTKPVAAIATPVVAAEHEASAVPTHEETKEASVAVAQPALASDLHEAGPAVSAELAHPAMPTVQQASAQPIGAPQNSHAPQLPSATMPKLPAQPVPSQVANVPHDVHAPTPSQSAGSIVQKMPALPAVAVPVVSAPQADNAKHEEHGIEAAHVEHAQEKPVFNTH